MTWAGKRKFLYISIFLIIFLAITIPIFYSLYPKPSCFDGKQNQNEKGIDCDGSCQKVCLERTTVLQILWTRSFKVSDGVYSAVAYISNSNFNLGARDVPYVFKLYDDRNIFIEERRGFATILPNTNFPIFEGVITTGNRIPKRAFFEFIGSPDFERLDAQPDLRIKNSIFRESDGKPRLSASVVNDSISGVKDISLVALLYDEKDTAIAASQTIIDEISKDSSKEIVFTWPEPFKSVVGRIEIYPKVFLGR